MDAFEAVLESWRRQSRMTLNLLSLFDEQLIRVKPAEDSWIAAGHFADIHGCRVGWLARAKGLPEPETGDLWFTTEDSWDFVTDLAVIRSCLERSAGEVEEFVRSAEDGPAGCYDHPVIFLQHQLWHEGYHFGMLHLALRQGGAEPNEEWEEENVWGLWRGPL